METKAKEFIWSAKLSKDKKIAKWSGRQDGVLEQIVLKLAVLGAGAQKNERNLVQVTSFDCEMDKVNTCICALTVGQKENQQLGDLSLFPPANFTLIEGSGPVHIVGNHIMFDEDDLSDDDDISGSEVEAEYEDLREKLKARKEKGKGEPAEKPEKNGGQQKSKKTAEDEEEDSDDEEDDFEMDDDFEDDEEDEEEEEEDIAKGKTAKGQNQAAQQKKTTIPVDVDDDDEEEEDLEDDDEEEEEKEEAPAKKRKLTNGKSATPAKQLTSPERTQKKPAEQKTPRTPTNAAPKTPKSEKKTPGKIQYTSVDQIKSAISKYPGGKPRKEDKFCNWVKNTFRVAEATWITELWKWHKKEIGL